MHIRRALVPIDGSEVSLKACQLARQFAEEYGWEVTLLHVVEKPPMPGFTFPDDVRERVMAEMRELGHQTLAQAEEVFASTDVQVTSKLVEGPASEMIIQEAEAGCCGIIVLGSTGLGRARISTLLLGGVAEPVIRRIKIPVLLVKPDTEIPAG